MIRCGSSGSTGVFLSCAIRNTPTKLSGKQNSGTSCERPGWSATLREGDPVTLVPLRFNTAYGAIAREGFALDRLFAAFD